MAKCVKCGMEGNTWKCAVCGKESEGHNPDHTHGEPASNRYHMPKCEGCSEAEVHCNCDTPQSKTAVA